MHDTKIVISEGKKTAMETTINYILINTREANKSDFFPYLPNDQIYTENCEINNIQFSRNYILLKQ